MSVDAQACLDTPAIVCRGADDCDDLDLKLSRAWLKIAIAGVFAGQGMMFSLALNMTPPPHGSPAYLILHGGLIFSSLVVMGFLGRPLFSSTWGMLRARRISIEGLFTLSLLGAFIGSVVGSLTGQGDVFYEVVAIVIAIYTFGRMLGERSQARLKLESERLRERFDRAMVADGAGIWVERPISQVSPGARVCVEPGSAFSVDGWIVEGVGYVEETALTGEPLPVVRRPGDRVRAGTWAVDCRFVLEVEHSLGARELDTILQAVEAADGRPSGLQIQADALVRVFLPFVVLVSLSSALYWIFAGSWIDVVLNSMAVLLVACPCALGLATPVAISQGLFRLAQMGLVSRDGALIDALAKTKKVFFDKTGTLSESSLRVIELWLDETLPMERTHLLSSVLEAESSVPHPIARALTQYLVANDMTAGAAIEDLRLIPGQGLECRVSGAGGAHMIRVGEASLGASEPPVDQLHEKKGKRVFVWLDGRIVACFVLQESLRASVDTVWQQFDELEVATRILTGDPSPEVSIPKKVALEAGLSSADKVRRVTESQIAGESPLFVGDGINDAAAMRVASGSVAMDSGAGLARSAAMGQLTGDRIEIIPQAISLARDIYRRLRGNLIYAAAYNTLGMVLAAAGLLHPVAAAMIMLVSSFWVTARAMGRGA
ncbi:MAG: heavy metal translocating P-type ATPase [Puniceicoccaceae bacterium]|nr:heavy metal translocating P-type ATPase [Puniceicoccaceae bacterium]MBL6912794.1 heavy metal translocating P-type ATPase [Puniceicoccaceae bacterium]